MSRQSEIIRTMFGTADQKRDASLRTPDDIVRFDNIQYGENAQWQLLDVYRPKNTEGKKLPVIVSVHGGAWVYGTKETYQYYCMDLAKRGFAVVNFTYRLAPEFLFPAGLEDTNLVFKWIIKNANHYLFNTDNIFAVGDSAGANYLGIYCDFLINEEYQKQFDFQPPEELHIKAVALNCGKYRFDVEGETDTLTKNAVKELLPVSLQDESISILAVDDHMTENFPATFVMTAVDDFLRTQAPILLRKLEELQIPHVFKCYGDDNNKLQHVFHCDIKTEDAKICNDDECAFFKHQID